MKRISNLIKITLKLLTEKEKQQNKKQTKTRKSNPRL